MELDEFSFKLNKLCSEIGIDIDNNDAKNYYKYMCELIEWNKNMNLTAITEPNEVILKHFIYFLKINKYIEDNKKMIDVGTGAGFPGIPVGIIRKNVDILLMDSLNKRIKFLDTICNEINLNNIKTIHARAEELAKNKEYREKFDYATSRAVASLNVLLEYMLPFVKVGGKCICMKGSNITDELKNSDKALKGLGGEL